MEMPFSTSTQTRRGPWLILAPSAFLKVTGEQSWSFAVVCKPFSQRSHTSAKGRIVGINCLWLGKPAVQASQQDLICMSYVNFGVKIALLIEFGGNTGF
jgi:cephalosporin hydroxylase